MIKVLLVDDHDLVRLSVSRLLAEVPDIKIVGEACTGEEAIQMVREKNPDVVLMDVKMPGMGGCEATRDLLNRYPNIKVIALTACEASPYPAQLLQAGASGYLTKSASVKELVEAIKAVHAGKRYLTNIIAQQLALKPSLDDHLKPFKKLSKRELQITEMITKGQEVKEIAEELALSPKTVNTYRYRIYEKLEVKSDVELTLFAIRHGMVKSDPQASMASF